MEERDLTTYFSIIDEGGDVEKDMDARRAINASNNQVNPIVDVKTLVLGMNCGCKRTNCLLFSPSLDQAVMIVTEYVTFSLIIVLYIMYSPCLLKVSLQASRNGEGGVQSNY
jgi:hypothetical protein